MRVGLVCVALLLAGCTSNTAPIAPQPPPADPLDAVFKDQPHYVFTGANASVRWQLLSTPTTVGFGVALIKIPNMVEISHKLSGSGGSLVFFGPVAAFWNVAECGDGAPDIRARGAMATGSSLKGNYTAGWYLAMAFGNGGASVLLNTSWPGAPLVNVTEHKLSWVTSANVSLRSELKAGASTFDHSVVADGAWFGYAQAKMLGPNLNNGYKQTVSINDQCQTKLVEGLRGFAAARIAAQFGVAPAGPMIFKSDYEPAEDLSGPRTHELKAAWAIVKKPAGVT